MFAHDAVLPPVLVPRFSEYPSTMPSFQQASDGSMPCNVNFPHGFPQLSPDNSAPGSPFSLPGTVSCSASHLNSDW
jgi:hypothetical protein